MKNNILVFGLMLVFVVSALMPGIATAQSATGLSATQIDAILMLLRSFGAPESTIQNVDNALHGRPVVSEPTPVTPPPAFCYTFTKNLRIGDRGADVDALVQALVKEGLLSTAPGERILGEDFNESVASAVTALQEKYFSEILRPVALTHGNGFVGPATRAKLNALYGCSVATPIPTPVKEEPNIVVTNPSEREYKKGDLINIQWRKYSGSDPLNIVVRSEAPGGELSSRIIAQNVSASSQSYPWVVDFDNIRNRYQIEVYPATGRELTGRSRWFMVVSGSASQPSITVLSPNGGDTYRFGDTVAINWSASGTFGANDSFGVIVYNYPSKTHSPFSTTVNSSVRSVNWTIPSDFKNMEKYTVYVVNNATGHADESNSFFTITAPSVTPTPTPTATPAPTISVSAGTLLPHSLAPRGSVAPFTNIVLTPKGGTARVDGITVERSGGGGNSDAAFRGVIVYDTYKSKIIGEAVFNSASQAHVRFYEPLSFSSVKTLTIAGVMGDDLASNAGRTPTLNIVQINSSNEIFGAFPISGSIQTINVGLSIGRLHYAFSPSYKSFSALWIKNGSIEAVRLEGILLKNHGGSVSIGGDKYSCSANYSNRGDLCFINRVIGKGESLTIVPASGAAQMRDMSDLNVLNSLNIIATGELYGYHTLPVLTEWPMVVSQPISGATVSAELLSETADKAGAWYLFGPGRGHGNANPADWVWQAKLSLNATKRIKSILLAHNTSGEFWSTSADMTGIGKLAYPLVVVASNGNQLNASYDQPFAPDTSAPAYGNFDFPAGAYTFKLYGQRESEKFTSGKLTVTFTDGTSVTGVVPGTTVTTLSSSSLTVISPNGGETIMVRDTGGVKFSASNLIGRSVRFSYANIDTGASYQIGVFSVSGNGNNAEAFRINSTIPSGRYKGRLEVIGSDPLIYDDSDSYFTITAPEATPIPTPVVIPAAVPETSVTVMSPNGGESFVAGQEVTATLKVSTTRADLKYGLALAPYSDTGNRLIDFPVLSACGKLNTPANSTCKDVPVVSGTYTANLIFKVPSPLVPSDTVATKYKLEAYLVESTDNTLVAKDLSDTTFTIPVAK